jgi:hypothetical protein
MKEHLSGGALISDHPTPWESLCNKSSAYFLLHFSSDSTLANSTLIYIILRNVEMLILFFSKSKNIVKDNSEYFGIFHLLK